MLLRDGNNGNSTVYIAVMVPEHVAQIWQDGDEEEDDDAGSVASTSSSEQTAAGSGKKKKKKTKKKKKDGSDPSSNHEASSSKPKLDKAEAEKRFSAALDLARKDDDLWINLASSSVPSGKAKKLFEALKSNETVTSVDLSCNQINDEGAQAIAGFLGMNGTPALIDLDLRDNPLTHTGLQVLEGLMKIRKKLIIKTGSIQEPEPEPPKASKELRDLSKGKMFRKFFQTGDDDDDNGGLSHQESQLDDRGINPTELWDGIKEVQKVPIIPQLTAKLQQLCVLLARETQAIQSQHSNALDGSKPHIKECVANLEVLKSCLEIVPRMVTVQYSSTPQPAVGTHRVMAAEALALLLSHNNTSLDYAVCTAGVVPCVMHLALAHRLCSSLHTRTLRMFRSCLSSSVPDLVMQMMQPGWGRGLGDPVQQSQEECRPLPELVAAIATPVIGVPSGMRSPDVGFVLELSKALQQSPPVEGRLHKKLAVFLKADGPWSEFAAEGGPMQQLLQEQSGDLCGPRPVRPPVEEGNELAKLAGGGLMSGREIMALLEGMSAMGVMS